MKFISHLREQSFNILLFLIIIIIFFVYYLFGIDTKWDEGFYLMSYDNDSIILTQSYKIINLLFGNMHNSLIKARLIKFLFQISSILIFFFLLKKTLPSNQIKLYHLLLFFIPSLIIYEKVLSYREIHQFLVFMIVGLTYFYFYKNKLKTTLFFIAFFLVIASFNIPTSGIILFLLFYFLILVNGLFNKYNIKNILLEYFWLSFFVVVSLFIVHFFLIDLIFFKKSIIDSYNKISNSASGHSLIDLFLNYIPVVKEFILFSIFLIVLFFIEKKEVIKKQKHIFKLLLFSIVLFVGFYRNSIGYIYMYITLPFMVNYFLNNKGGIFDKLMMLILLLLPIISSFGTNTPISLMVLFFTPVWYIFFIKLKKDKYSFYSLILVLMTSIVFFHSHKEYSNILGNYFNSKEKLNVDLNIDSIKVNKDQKEFFLFFNKLINRRKRDKEGKDLYFTFYHSMIVVYAFNGELVGLPYHQLSNYILDFNSECDKSIVQQPDILILNLTEVNVLTKFNLWDFPIEYDKFQYNKKGSEFDSRMIFLRKNR